MRKKYCTPIVKISMSQADDVITTSASNKGDVFESDLKWDEGLWSQPW